MKSFKETIKEGKAACKVRGHKMSKFGFTVSAEGVRGGCYCLKCGKVAQFVSNPRPNEIDISGEAVALYCTAQ